MCDFACVIQNGAISAGLGKEELKMEGSSRWCCKAAGGRGWVGCGELPRGRSPAEAGTLGKLFGIREQKWRCLEVLFKKISVPCC